MASKDLVGFSRDFRLITVICLASLSFPLVTDAQDGLGPVEDRTARALLVSVANTYANLEQFYFEALETTEISSEGSTRKSQVRYVTAADSGGHARFSESDGMNDGVVVFDGSAHWTYSPLLKQYTRHSKMPSFAPSSGYAISNVFDVNKKVLRYVRRYRALTERLQEAHFVTDSTQIASSQVTVEAVYDTPVGVPRGKIRRKYSISTKLGLVMHELSITSMDKSGAHSPMLVRKVTTFLSAVTDDDVPAEMFIFKVPVDAELVDQLSSTPLLISRLENQTAPEFTLEDFNGKTHRSQELKGKVIVLDFWATWCKPCRVDLPHIETLFHDLADQNLVVLAVSTEEASRSRTFFNQQGYSFPSLVDKGGHVSQQYFVTSMPTVVIIDREGKIASYLVGLHTEERLRSELKKLGIQ